MSTLNQQLRDAAGYYLAVDDEGIVHSGVQFADATTEDWARGHLNQLINDHLQDEGVILHLRRAEVTHD